MRIKNGASYDHKYDKFYFRFQTLEKVPTFSVFDWALMKYGKKYLETKVVGILLQGNLYFRYFFSKMFNLNGSRGF